MRRSKADDRIGDTGVRFRGIERLFSVAYEWLAEVEERSEVASEGFSIHIDRESAGTSDLYRIGRLLSSAHLIRHALGAPVEFRIDPSAAGKAETLHRLGFDAYCSLNGFKFGPQYPVASQQALPPLVEALHKKTYWYSLLPLTSFPCPEERDEGHALALTGQILESVASYVREQSLRELNLEHSEFDFELDHIVFGVLKELVVNSLLHSGSDSLTIALTMSRETGNSARTHRPGMTLEDSQDAFEVLVMDGGSGVLKTVQEKLGVAPDPHSGIYQSLSPWGDQFRAAKQREEALLNSIFQGNLAVRKGRKSEGLHDVASRVDWFGGILNYRTGRSELQVRDAGARTSVRRDTRDYLPGVVASALLPSHQIRLLFSRAQIAHGSVPRSTLADPQMPAVLACPALPEGLFGGQTNLGSQRRCELYARELIEHYRAAAEEKPEERRLLEIDLALSRTVSIDFLDTLLQELCKASAKRRQGEPDYVRRLFFSNTRRSIIRGLQQRNCNSLLMMSNSLCLFLDEADQPHFLGLPRLANRQVLDTQELMGAVFYGQTVTEAHIRSRWRFDEDAFHSLGMLFTCDTSDLFYRTESGRGPVYSSQNVLAALGANRQAQVDSSREFVRTAGPTTVIKTGNAYFDGWIDFPGMWGDVKRLTDCAKLLLSSGEVTSAHTVVGFMHNGDRLAGAVQRLTGAPKLVIADPNNPQTWEQSELDGGYILVVDALYPDDEQASVGAFIAKQAERGFTPNTTIAFADLRNAHAQDGVRSPLLGIKVASLLDHRDDGMPALVKPGDESVVIPMGEQKRAAGGQDTDLESSQGASTARRREYSDEELSAEFWHNASTFGIIASKRTGREGRDILFYENNERIIENQRTRSLLEEFVADFVRDRLGLRVDVILHPSHPAGALLAQLAARQLSTPPLILPLGQREYGGRIEMSREEYAWFRRSIVSLDNDKGQAGLNALLVDDSILTGSSIVTMLGLADLLGLKTRGVLVLVNRLPRGVSAAFEALPSEFGYLYRLHMPVLSKLESPDSRTREWSHSVARTSSSFFAGQWSDWIIRSPDDSYFLRDDERVERSLGLCIPTDYPDIFSVPASTSDEVAALNAGRRDDWIQRLRPHETRQIIEGLLLHDDPTVLDLFTRMAVAYNFLEHLVEEPAFWRLLDAWIDSGLSQQRETNEIYFARKLMYLMAFSRHIRVPSVFRCFRHFCRDVAERCLAEEKWRQVPDLLCDCFLALAAVGDTWVVEQGRDVVERLAGDVLCGDEVEGLGNAVRSISWRVIGAYAWSIAVLANVHRIELYGSTRGKIRETFEAVAGLGEAELLSMDAYEPYVLRDSDLRKSISVRRWDEQERFLHELFDLEPMETGMSAASEADAIGALKMANPMFRYLTDALGYTFTLKSVLMACKADTVLLFAKSRSDKRYYVRDYQTRERKRPQESLSSDHLSDESIAPRIRQRMADGLFFFSTSPDELETLGRFSAGGEHRWMFGARVRAKSSGELYYLILGYRSRPWQDGTLRTAYYYWLRCEAILRVVLPAIHEQHIMSSTAWHALIQSVGPVHPIKTGTYRRKLVATAMGRLDLGELLRRAVTTSTQEALRPPQVLASVRRCVAKVRTQIREASAYVMPGEPDGINLASDEWPVQFVTTGHDLPREVGYLSFHNALLEFVLYECLCNALVNCLESVTVSLGFAVGESPTEDRAVTTVLVVENDCPASGLSTGRVSGISACKKAADAVGGWFDSAETNPGRWRAELRLPCYGVPDKLTEWLRELLT